MSIWTFQQSYFPKWKRIEIKQEIILQFFSKTQKKKKKWRKILTTITIKETIITTIKEKTIMMKDIGFQIKKILKSKKKKEKKRKKIL